MLRRTFSARRPRAPRRRSRRAAWRRSSGSGRKPTQWRSSFSPLRGARHGGDARVAPGLLAGELAAAAAPVPRGQTSLQARADVDMDEVAAIAADTAELGLVQRPGMQRGRAHAGNAEIGGLAVDMLRAVAGIAAVRAMAVAVDLAVIGERAVAGDHFHAAVEVDGGATQHGAQRLGQRTAVR